MAITLYTIITINKAITAIYKIAATPKEAAAVAEFPKPIPKREAPKTAMNKKDNALDTTLSKKDCIA